MGVIFVKTEQDMNNRVSTLLTPAGSGRTGRLLRSTALAVMVGLAGLGVAPMQAFAFAAPESFADLAEQISPAVVNITTETRMAQPMQPGPQFPPGSPFEEFFKEFMDPPGNGPHGQRGPQESVALGSGFVVSEDGYIVTNNHVIDGADSITVEFFSGEKLPAKVIGTDPKTDIALLKVDSDKPLAAVPFGNSDTMRVGDWVMAVGNPLGQGFSVSAGIVSARNRELSGTYDDFIQTDAAINRGNSGGPLFNMAGEVIGVNTAILSPNGGSIGIGFSMASNVVSKVVAQLKEFGETRRGWLGVKIQDITPDMAEAMELAATEGALVTDVPAGPAADAGMKAGDVIVSFDGHSVADTRDLVRRVADAPVGKAVDVVVMRDGKETNLSITLGRRETAENEATPAQPGQPEAPAQVLGMTLAPLDDSMRAEMGLADDAQGLVVQSLDETGDAWDKGLRPGDVITEAGQQPVAQVGDLNSRIDEAREAGRKSVLLLVRRGGEPRFVALSVN